MRKHITLVFAVFVLLASGVGTVAADHEPPSDAERMDIYHGWDHGRLTIAIHAGKGVPQEMVAAVERAIATWNEALAHRFGRDVVLVDVTGRGKEAAQADIVVQLNRSNGMNTGVARCDTTFDKRNADCDTRIWGHQETPSKWAIFTDDQLYFLAVHELGHALGLGHADPIMESMDVMGYGWMWDSVPDHAITACDMDGLEAVFAWVLAGTEPAPPTVESIAC